MGHAIYWFVSDFESFWIGETPLSLPTVFSCRIQTVDQ